MKRGTCKLCLLKKDLCDSHYMPRAMYKYNRATAIKNPNPVILSGAEAKQSSSQVRDYAVCRACERLLNLNGEEWVLANVPHDYGAPFPLHAALKGAVPAIAEPGLALLAGMTTKGFEMDKLIYFGASVFWRGAAHSWKPVDGQKVPQVHLGAYQEQLRQFLLGKSSFPAEISLTVMVWEHVPPLVEI